VNPTDIFSLDWVTSLGWVASFWAWEGWSALVAIGTLSLAAVTGFLVLRARQQIDSQLQIARMSQAPFVKPLEWPDPMNDDHRWGDGTEFWLRNAGKGAAWDIRCHLEWPAQNWTWDLGPLTLGPNEEGAAATVGEPTRRMLGDEWIAAHGHLVYRDSMGNEWKTEFRLEGGRTGPLRMIVGPYSRLEERARRRARRSSRRSGQGQRPAQT
jgi:hypothetical protein